MESDEFKNIWRSDVNKGHKPFSKKELNDMIINSAKKSMRKLNPVWIIGLGLLCAAYIIWKIMSKTSVLGFVISYTILLLILLVALSVRIWSMYKMNKYDADMPVKAWLQYRINSIDNTLRFQKRYGTWLNIIIVVCAFGGMLFNLPTNILYISPVTMIYIRIITLTIIILIALWAYSQISKAHKKGLKKTLEIRDYLQRLYDGIGE